MGIVFRQSVKTTIVIFAGNFLGALFSYFGAYVFKDDMQQFGFSRTIINIGVIFQLIILLGSGAVIQLFIQRYEPDDPRKKVLITLCSIAPIIGAAILLPFYLWFRTDIILMFQPDDRHYFAQYYLWVPVLIVLWSYMMLLEYYMLSQQKTAQAIFMREVLLRVANIAVLVAFYYGLISFHTFIVGSVLVYGLPLGALFLLSMRTEGFGFSKQWMAFRLSEYKEILHFSWYHLLGGISFSLIGFLDTLMLASIDKQGLAAVPVYIMATFLVNIMTVPYRAMTNAVIPVLNRAYLDQDKHKLQEIFNRSGINMLIVAVAMFLVIGLNLGNAVAILPKGYEALLPIALIMMIGRMADMVTGLNSEVINISSLYKFNFRISLVLLAIIIGLNYLLIPGYGAYGAAWSVTIAQIVFNVSKVIFIRRKMSLRTFSKQTLIVGMVGAVTACAVYFIPFIINPVVDTLTRTAAIVIVFTALLIWLRPSEDINVYLVSVLKKKRLF